MATREIEELAQEYNDKFRENESLDITLSNLLAVSDDEELSFIRRLLEAYETQEDIDAFLELTE